MWYFETSTASSCGHALLPEDNKSGSNLEPCLGHRRIPVRRRRRPSSVGSDNTRGPQDGPTGLIDGKVPVLLVSYTSLRKPSLGLTFRLDFAAPASMDWGEIETFWGLESRVISLA